MAQFISFFFILDILINNNLFYKYRYLQTIKIDDKDVKIKKWKIGQFFQYMFPLIAYEYDPDNPFTIGNFKARIHRPGRTRTDLCKIRTVCEIIKGKLIIISEF